MDSKRFKREFWQNAVEMPICQIADQVPGLYVFAKDLEGRHVLGNKRTLQRCGCQSEEELLGKTDYDFYPQELCAKYAEDDRLIIESGESILELSELAVNESGVVDWFITNKFPIKNRNGKVVGTIGTTIEYNKSHASYTNYSEIYPAVKYLRDHFTTNLSVQDLADQVRLSVRQFQRKFKARFHMSIREYIIRLRVHKACDLLRNSDMSLADIAYETGFYDQSAFTRQFKTHVNESPLQYRKKEKK
ncbi:MAG: AraC family transcriptional regulator [Lentisphaeraceae bacterium]|nr:AraC family transcriptional regulator [Lentisphaeraceae bacterium]